MFHPWTPSLRATNGTFPLPLSVPRGTVGWPTVKAIVGNKRAPRFADWYLSRQGYEAQQTDEPVEAGRVDNLWEPVPGDHGAHGDFDARSLPSSWQFRLSKHKTSFALAGLAIAAALLALAKDTRRVRLE